MVLSLLFRHDSIYNIEIWCLYSFCVLRFVLVWTSPSNYYTVECSLCDIMGQCKFKFETRYIKCSVILLRSCSYSTTHIETVNLL